MRILLVNDDGYDQPGLRVLDDVVSGYAEVWSVAPLHHCSGSSSSLGLYGSMELKVLGGRRWALEGTPTDCVKVALLELLQDQRPDLIVSGINPGANMANNIHYSGTVAAATEGALWDVPAMAVSVDVSGTGREPFFDTAAEVVRTLLEERVQERIPLSTVLNVNVPALPCDEIAGWEWTRAARFAEDVPLTHLEPGRVFTYSRYRRLPVRETAGTDVDALSRGMVSLTLLHTDRTCPDRIRGIGPAEPPR